MKKNLIFVSVAILTFTCCVFAADWVQIYEKIYLDASSLSPFDYYANYNNDRIYSVWSKWLNNGTETWKKLEKESGKKIWYNKTLYVINCTKKEFAIKSSVAYDLKENVVNSYNLDYLEWLSITPETVGEIMYTNVCRATAPQIKIRSHR